MPMRNHDLDLALLQTDALTRVTTTARVSSFWTAGAVVVRTGGRGVPVTWPWKPAVTTLRTTMEVSAWSFREEEKLSFRIIPRQTLLSILSQKMMRTFIPAKNFIKNIHFLKS